MLHVSDAWRQAHKGASAGLMVVENVLNLEQYSALERCKKDLEIKLRAMFTSKEQISKSFPISIYSNYYKRYKKTYHVLQQIESIVFKDKEIPSVAPTVEAMFMAELKNGLLTAGHAYEALKFPLTLDTATGNETYLLINGKEQVLKPQDMMISDQEGVISSIIHGPDLRTRILPDTRKVVFTVYAPADIPEEAVVNHLADIYGYIKLVCPQAKVTCRKVYS